MSLKWKFTTFILLLNAIAAVCLYHIFIDKKWVFILIEFGLLAFLFYGIELYRQFMEPVRVMQNGISAISDEDFTVKYIDVGNFETDEIIGIYNNMIDRLRSEKVRTEELGFFLQKIIDKSPVGIIIYDYDGNIETINLRAKNILAPYLTQVGNIMELDSTIYELFLNAKNADKVIELQHGVKLKSHFMDVMHMGFEKRVILFEELTNEILSAQKEAYGKVIRMMAHEMNNSAGAINSILQTFIENGFDKSESIESIEIYKSSLKVALDRNKALVNFMDNFASILRLPKPHMMSFDMNELLQRCVNLFVEKGKQNDIHFEIKCNDSAQEMRGDPVQIEQVIVNILKNAMESIGNGGIIKIEFIDSKKLVISDNGPGISIKDQKKLLTPFFSTKTNGQGIGLMLINDILLAHDATFSLSTEEDGWTRFVIFWDNLVK